MAQVLESINGDRTVEISPVDCETRFEVRRFLKNKRKMEMEPFNCNLFDFLMIYLYRE